MRRLLVALILAATPAVAEISWGDSQFDTTTCGAWEKLDMTGRIDALRALEPFGDVLEASDRGAAEDWAGEVAKACLGAPARPLSEAAREAMQPD